MVMLPGLMFLLSEPTLKSPPLHESRYSNGPPILHVKIILYLVISIFPQYPSYSLIVASPCLVPLSPQYFSIFDITFLYFNLHSVGLMKSDQHPIKRY